VRFARLIQRRGRVLGGPAVRAAYGGNPSLIWLPRRVLPTLTARWAHVTQPHNRSHLTRQKRG
jgi:hypothetical protein